MTSTGMVVKVPHQHRCQNGAFNVAFSAHALIGIAGPSLSMPPHLKSKAQGLEEACLLLITYYRCPSLPPLRTSCARHDESLPAPPSCWHCRCGT